MSKMATKTMSMSVDNTAFLVDRLGEDCGPLQYVRELTQNSIEAILRLPNDSKGEIVWDIDEFLLNVSGLRKLCIVDNGVGMTGEEQVKYINQLSSSASHQAMDRNFGIGAKIAGVTKNPAGLMYMSYRDSVGSLVHLWKDPNSGSYGLRGIENSETGGVDYVRTGLDEAIKPKIIGKHGTKVILVGRTDEDETVLPPAGARAPTKWLRRYLNTRYFRFPDRVRVRVREGWDLEPSNQNYTLREVNGQSHFLKTQAKVSGTADLGEVLAHWWILPEDSNLASNFSHFAATHHMAVLFQDELYDFTDGQAAVHRLMQCGIVLGYSRVVLYFEPKIGQGTRISANTARTDILIDSESVPWAEWTAAFRKNLPDEIVAMMAEIGSDESASSNREAILQRLRKMKDLFTFSRYRPSLNGAFNIGEAVRGGDPKESGEHKGKKAGTSGTKGGNVGDIYAIFAEAGERKGDAVETFDIPAVQWVTRENKTRDAGFLEDRAAKYLFESNLIQINGDFRGFTDMIKRYETVYQSVPGARLKIESIVREWFEQTLIEAVLGLMAIKDSPEWNPDQTASAWSEEALTAAVMPRSLIDFAIRRALGTKLGSVAAREQDNEDVLRVLKDNETA